MTSNLSKTQIDRLGDRLRKGPPSESDLIYLEEYRRSFKPAYEFVLQAIRDRLQLEPTGRPGKSTRSLTEKLNRESIRLTQVQDIAGCRVIAADIAKQDQLISSLKALFSGASVVDRRAKPSFGYRAAHLIVNVSGKLVEIQVRTALQHIWAELSEKYSDVIDPTIKYGGGPDKIRTELAIISGLMAECEDIEYTISNLLSDKERKQNLQDLQERTLKLKKRLADGCSSLISWLDQFKRQQQ